MPQVQETPSHNINAKSVAKYALLPGIFPRLQRLAAHLSQFLFMFTQVFGTVGLIDRNHPCLKPENIGRYRFRDILGLAASNVVFDKKHIPQIVMFFVVILSIVLIVAIFLAFVASLLMNVQTAQAQLFGTPQGFDVPNLPSVEYGTTREDWAFNFLYRIFGETGMFPRPADGNVGNAWFTSILVGMLKYYSLAMLVVAALMILYILIITVTESARTGQPFGSRFDGIWAPVRLALAIGLLMPVATGGYNGAQMIVFQSAIWGSNLATNVWYGGLAQMSKDSKKFFTTMMGDPGYRFVRDIFLVNLCVAGLEKQGGNGTLLDDDMVYKPTAQVGSGKVTFNFGTENAPDFCGQVDFLIMPGLTQPKALKGKPYWPQKVTDGYVKILADFLPVDDPAKFTTRASTASEIFDMVVDPDGEGDQLEEGEAVVRSPNLMSDVVNYAADKAFASTEGTDIPFGKSISDKYADGTQVKKWMMAYWKHLGLQYACAENPPEKIEDWKATPPTNCQRGVLKSLYFQEKSNFYPSIEAYNNWILQSMSNDARFGWTTAGVFYLRISSALGEISNVINNAPVVTQLPSNLTKPFSTVDSPSGNTEMIQEQCTFGSKLSHWLFESSTDGRYEYCEKFELSQKINQFLRGGKEWFKNSVKNDKNGAYALMDTENFDRALELSEPGSATNATSSTISAPVLGGLAKMAQIDSKDMNPLGTVVSWGNFMITLSMIAFAIGLIGNGASWAEFAFTLGGMLLIPGFVLAFWVPTIPFIHFVFAVIEWMISIMEAVIGMPLWALSLITLEGDGLGKLGMAGVKRIFEIILRPTIIILSLVASVLIFTAGVSFFNSALALYADAQDSSHSTIKGIGMVFVYMFGIYSLATASFKLIDTIPDNFGRWMGLEKGFGSNIKSGLSELEGLIVGGAALQGITSIGRSVGGAQKNAKDARDRKKAEDDLQDKLDRKVDK